ncbi:MAG: methylenetetrahydrofolate reductase C-terminal domain-containing protein [Eubacteriaceae bacterium]|nr:methylenetetrahydrofolate reductase C-terminal domain-containing protein [Eubacteriaceae bacterium]
MIITKQKPFEELLQMLEGCKNVVLTGCGECATVCKTGSAEALEELKAKLEAHGINVLGSMVMTNSCNKLLVKKEIKQLKEVLPEADAIISAACGDGVQTVATNTDKVVYPSNNTLFLGEIERQGIFSEACKLCGDCVLADTAAICPVTKCAKSLTNGPCGGAKDGKCEVNPENDCAWILIYNRLKDQGRLDRLMKSIPTKDYGAVAYPRVLNTKEEGK